MHLEKYPKVSPENLLLGLLNQERAIDNSHCKRGGTSISELRNIERNIYLWYTEKAGTSFCRQIQMIDTNTDKNIDKKTEQLCL